MILKLSFLIPNAPWDVDDLSLDARNVGEVILQSKLAGDERTYLNLVLGS